jgi:PTS system fructose-specific IIC component
MAKTLLGAAANKAHLEMIDNPAMPNWRLFWATTLPADSALNGKKCGWAILIARWRIRNCS